MGVLENITLYHKGNRFAIGAICTPANSDFSAAFSGTIKSFILLSLTCNPSLMTVIINYWISLFPLSRYGAKLGGKN